MNKIIATSIGAAGVLALSSIGAADVILNDVGSEAQSIYTLGESVPTEDQDNGATNPWGGQSNVAFNNDTYGSGTSQADADHAWTLTSDMLTYQSTGSTNSQLNFGESLDVGLSSNSQTTLKFSVSAGYDYAIELTMNQQGPGATSGSLKDSSGTVVLDWSYNDDGGIFSGMGSLAAGDYVLTMDTFSYYQQPVSFSGESLSYQGESQYDMTFSVMIPLPAAGFMGLAGIGGLAFTRRRRDDA